MDVNRDSAESWPIRDAATVTGRLSGQIDQALAVGWLSEDEATRLMLRLALDERDGAPCMGDGRVEMRPAGLRLLVHRHSGP